MGLVAGLCLFLLAGWVVVGIVRSGALPIITGRTPPTVRSPIVDLRTIERAHFSFDYPADWIVYESDPDHVALEIPDQALFFVDSFQDRELCDKAFEVLLRRFRDKIEDRREGEFERWGRYRGRGKELRGGSDPASSVTFRAFQHVAGDRGFVAAEISFAQAVGAHEPRFARIRETFVFERE